MAEVLNLRHKMPFNANEQDSPAIDTIKKTMTFVIVFFIWRLVRGLIRFSGLRILRKSEVEQSERTRVSEGEICDNEVKQITRPRNSKIKEVSSAQLTFLEPSIFGSIYIQGTLPDSN